MAAEEAELYEADFYAWTQRQAAALRHLADRRWNGPLDLLHLAEEVEDLGDERRNAVRSQVRRIIEHCLKLRHSPAEPPRLGWKISIDNARSEIADRLTATIRRDIEEQLPRLYREGARVAVKALQERGEDEASTAVPAQNPWTLAELLADDWYPEAAGEG